MLNISEALAFCSYIFSRFRFMSIVMSFRVRYNFLQVQEVDDFGSLNCQLTTKTQ